MRFSSPAFAYTNAPVRVRARVERTTEFPRPTFGVQRQSFDADAPTSRCAVARDAFRRRRDVWSLGWTPSRVPVASSTASPEWWVPSGFLKIRRKTAGKKQLKKNSWKKNETNDGSRPLDVTRRRRRRLDDDDEDELELEDDDGGRGRGRGVR